MAEQGFVLVVDDDAAKRYIVSRLLRGAGYTVEEAATGGEALKKLSARKPELVVLDVKLPDIDGMEVARRIKADPALKGVLVLQLSAAMRDAASRTQGLDAGADSFLVHPVDEPELLATVRALLRIGRSETALLETNARLRNAEQTLRLALDATQIGLWEWDLATNEMNVSAELRRLFALPETDSVSAELLLGMVLPEDRPRLEAMRDAALRGEDGGRLQTEYRLRKANGEVATFEGRGQVIRDGSGQPARFLGTLLDITARKEREVQAERWSEFQQIMLGVVGHDLRNPLTAIITTAALQLRKTHDEGVKRAFTRINASANRATRIVNGLLDYTRARLGAGIPVERTETDLVKVLRSVVDEVHAAHPDRTVALELAGGDFTGSWDPDRLDQVFMNLIHNAVQYSLDGAEVRVVANASPTEVAVKVHNRGEPIPESVLPSIFEPFKRGAQGGKGLGLGLYIVNQVVRAHGGEVTAASDAVHGTTLTVRLPRAEKGP